MAGCEVTLGDVAGCEMSCYVRSGHVMRRDVSHVMPCHFMPFEVM